MKDYLTHSITHYLFAIHKLYEAGERTRYVDIANHLGVAKSSISVAVRKMKGQELIDEDKNKNLFLTTKGHEDVHEVLTNRTLLYYYFKDILKVSEKVAVEDSCKMEHLLSLQTQKKLFQFLKKFHSASETKNESFTFSKYRTLKTFKDSQMGDSHLT